MAGPGLWELIVATTPDDKIVINGDYDIYAEIMHSTNSLWRNNGEIETKPKVNKSWKWKDILKPIWEEKGSVYKERSKTFGSQHHFTM